MNITDFPKLESPFEREDVNGIYQCVPKLKPEFTWIFTDKCLAVDKLDGTNVSVVIQDNQIKNIYNRTSRIDLWKSGKWFYEGVRNSIENNNFNPNFCDDGQYFGELIGPKLQGNPYQLEEHRWVPFEYLKKNYYYKFWADFIKEIPEEPCESCTEAFTKISDLFKGLWSIYKRQRGLKGGVTMETTFEDKNSMAAEGIVFYNTDSGSMCKLRRDMFGWYRGRKHGTEQS